MKIPLRDEPPVPSDPEDEMGITLSAEQYDRLVGVENRQGRRLAVWEIAELFRRIRRSRKFHQWKPEIAPVGDKLVTERHFSPQELAISWGCSAEKIRCLFRRESGVLRIPSGRAGNSRRSYITMKIPESVAIRVHRRLSAIPQ